MALSDKIIGKFAVKKRNQMPQACMGGWVPGWSANGLVTRCSGEASPLSLFSFRATLQPTPLSMSFPVFDFKVI